MLLGRRSALGGLLPVPFGNGDTLALAFQAVFFAEIVIGRKVLTNREVYAILF